MKDRGQVGAENNSGSLKKGEPEFLAVGKLRKPFGLKGEMKFETYIDDLDIFKPGNQVYIGKKFTPRRITFLRESGKDILIQFEGVNNPEDAGSLTNQILYIPADRLPKLQEDVYYQRQLIGMQVKDEDGRNLGKITEIIETGANDVYVVFNNEENKEILIPAIKSVIQKIDIESNFMVVKLQEWLE